MNRSLFFSKLDKYTLIKVTGIEAQKYLQGQVTLDVLSMASNKLYFAAHCEPKGKVIALLMLWKIDVETFFYLIPKSLEEIQLKEIKKYAIFSKVTFEIVSEATFYFIHSIKRYDDLASVLNATSTEITKNINNSVDASDNETNREINNLQNNLKFHIALSDNTDFLLINFSSKEIANLLDNFDIELIQSDYTLFDKFMIENGIALLNPISSQEFLPQALNLQALDAISFSKGCYTGQEMVARAKYRGANKRALYFLKGKAMLTPKLGEGLLMRLGDNYKETGKILAFVKEENDIFLQIVLNHDIEKNAEFKIIDCDNSQLTIQQLPYIID